MDADFAIGARAGVSLSRLLSPDPSTSGLSRFDALIVFDWFLNCTNCNYFEVTPGVSVPIRFNETTALYLGAGVNIARFSQEIELDELRGSDTDIGLALFGGLEFPVGRFSAFGDIRTAVGGSEQVVITFGLLFGPA
jgi:hypothetical protein